MNERVCDRPDNCRIRVACHETVPKIIALSEQNYGHVVKSIPAEPRTPFVFASPLTAFDTQQKATIKGFNDADTKFKMPIAMVQQDFPKATQ